MRTWCEIQWSILDHWPAPGGLALDGSKLVEPGAKDGNPECKLECRISRKRWGKKIEHDELLPGFLSPFYIEFN